MGVAEDAAPLAFIAAAPPVARASELARWKLMPSGQHMLTPFQSTQLMNLGVFLSKTDVSPHFTQGPLAIQ